MSANYPTSVWDGTSQTRSDTDVKREPDRHDWEQLEAEVRAIQTQMQPLGIGAAGVLPTSDPTVAGQLWNSGGTITVSAG